MDQLIGGGKPAAGDVIKDTDTARFKADVIDASMEVPVIVDFWAPWCGPCKQLGPVIEKAVKEAKGAVRLVKINVDENQDLAAQMRIQSIPAVYAFFQGRPVDGFVGAQPESQLKQFVGRLAKLGSGAQGPSPVDEAVEQAEALFAAGEREEAIDQLLNIIRVNRAWNDEAARLQLVKFFEAMGPTDPLTLSGRRQLSSILFS